MGSGSVLKPRVFPMGLSGCDSVRQVSASLGGSGRLAGGDAGGDVDVGGVGGGAAVEALGTRVVLPQRGQRALLPTMSDEALKTFPQSGHSKAMRSPPSWTPEVRSAGNPDPESMG